MNKTLAVLALAASTPFLAASAGANEAAIRQAVQTLAPGAKVKAIGKTRVPGLMEVVLDGAQGPMVIYADEKGESMLVGDLLDVQSRRNLTRERMDKLLEVKWDSLPLANAIKIVRGNGQRRFAVFSDPDCPYCKRAETEFLKLDNVTIYVFPYPLPMHGDAPRKSRLVWCSKDRGQAWLDLMLKGRIPEGKANCDTPVEANLALGQKLRIDGTPAMILTNGKRIPGYVEAGKLDAMLNAAEGK